MFCALIPGGYCGYSTGWEGIEESEGYYPPSRPHAAYLAMASKACRKCVTASMPGSPMSQSYMDLQAAALGKLKISLGLLIVVCRFLRRNAGQGRKYIYYSPTEDRSSKGDDPSSSEETGFAGAPVGSGFSAERFAAWTLRLVSGYNLNLRRGVRAV